MLRNYIEVLRGKLEIAVRFPEQEPLYLSGLSELLQTAREAGIAP